MGIELKGTRVHADSSGWLDNEAMSRPGAYGRATAVELQARSPAMGWWQVTAPDGSMGCLDPKVHSVVEHENGTITVDPSIDFSKREPGRFHGYLRGGLWKSC